MNRIKVGLPPIARPDARLFILGSLPGDASLSAQRYYAHPTNQFWRLLGHAIREDLHALGYEERLERLAARDVGMWDVIAAAERPGSLDQAIRSPAHNPLGSLAAEYPHLRAVAFNGSTAARLGRRMLGESAGIALVDLPSSSAANTAPFAIKCRAWAELAQFLDPPHSEPR